MGTEPLLLPSLPVRFKPFMRALLIAAIAAGGTLLVASTYPGAAATVASVFAGLFALGLSNNAPWRFSGRKYIQAKPNDKNEIACPRIVDTTQDSDSRLHSSADLRCLIGALDSVREDEQKRLAREMHDDLGQLLAAMKMDLSALARQLPPDNDHALQQLEGINELVNSMLTSVRRIIADLPPKLLDDAGLFDALRLLAGNFEKRYGVSCNLHLPKEELLFPEKIASTLYRIAQESLNNTAKHACATCVDIIVKTEASTLTLSVVDNGRGASRTDLHKGRSFGLIGMRERAAALDGELRVETRPGTGMAVHVTLPVHESVTFVEPTARTARVNS